MDGGATTTSFHCDYYYWMVVVVVQLLLLLVVVSSCNERVLNVDLVHPDLGQLQHTMLLVHHWLSVIGTHASLNKREREAKRKGNGR